MSRSMLKFFTDKGGEASEHDGDLHWPGTVDGFPHRGKAIPDLTQREATEMPLALDYKSALFRLWEPAEKKKFDSIMDRIVNGWYMQHKREDKAVEGQIMPAVWLEWVQIYGETASTKVPQSPSGGLIDDPSNTEPVALSRGTETQHNTGGLDSLSSMFKLEL